MLSMDGTLGTIRGQVRRRDTVSPVGLAALVAALHLAVLTGRVPVWSVVGRAGTLQIWRVPADASATTARETGRVASRPVKSYSAGQLSLSAGMAIVALARWLRVMRLTGTQGQ
jgi:hypothetical protein